MARGSTGGLCVAAKVVAGLVWASGVLACSGEVTDDGASDARQEEVDGGLPGDDANGSPADAGQEGDASCADYGGLPAATTPPIAGDWTLTFEDHFLGSGVDDAKWKVGEHWAGINGVAGNAPENMSVECGYLTVTGEKRPLDFAGQSYDYATGELSTFKRFRQRYGYFEARVKYDAIQGFWPAFWLMPDRGNYGPGEEHRMSFVKFDLTGVSAGPLDSAHLELHVVDAESGTQNVILMRGLDDSWSEDTLTWASRPAVDPLWIEMKYDPQWIAGDTASFDVTSAVNEALAGDGVIAFALFDGSLRDRRVVFSSREGAAPPTLVLSGGAGSVVASADAWVAGGTLAETSNGSDTELHVEEPWRDNCSTYDGGMEVDIMESLGVWGDDMTSHAAHWDGYGSDHQSHSSGRQSFPAGQDGFHVYGLNWQPGLLEFYVDGEMMHSWADDRVASVDLYIILSLQFGGWQDDLGDNRIIDDSSLPGNLVVDYVRVWSGSP